MEFADLVAENFDPVLREADEPDWANPNKEYSEGVRNEMHRIERNDATVIIFPIWWWSMPALLKGWIDRVWNYGWAYGARKFPNQRVWMIGIAGADFTLFQKRGYNQAIDVQLNIGILDYCDIADHRLEILYGSLGDTRQVEEIMLNIERLASEF